MHLPGIEPGSIAWQATILPLNHRCSVTSNKLMTTIVLEVYTNSERRERKDASAGSRTRAFRVPGDTSPTKPPMLTNLKQIDGQYCSWRFHKKSERQERKDASAGNRTRVYRVAGDNSTTEPPMRDIYILRSHWFSVERHLCCRVFLLAENFCVLSWEESHLSQPARRVLYILLKW